MTDIETLSAELAEQLPDTYAPALLREIARVILHPTVADIEAMERMMEAVEGMPKSRTH